MSLNKLDGQQMEVTIIAESNPVACESKTKNDYSANMTVKPEGILEDGGGNSVAVRGSDNTDYLVDRLEDTNINNTSDNTHLLADTVEMNGALEIIVQQDDADNGIDVVEVDARSDNEEGEMSEDNSFVRSGRLAKVLSYEMGREHHLYVDKAHGNTPETFRDINNDDLQGIDVICGNCGKHFSSLNALGNHLSTQHAVLFNNEAKTTNIEVIQDDDPLRSDDMTDVDLCKPITDPSSENHQCAGCFKTFRSARILYRHSKICEMSGFVEIKQRPLVKQLVGSNASPATLSSLTCKICKKTFTRPSSLRGHIQTQHGAGIEENAKSSDSEFAANSSDYESECSDYEVPLKTLKVALAKCYVPNKRDASGKYVPKENHKDQLKARTCLHCDKVLSNPSNMRKHVRKMHSHRVKTEKGSKGLSENGSITDGSKSDDKKAQLVSIANIIPKKESNGLKKVPTKRHVQCPECNRPLSSQHALMEHMRTHTGERPFKCQECERAFTTPRNLKKHMLSIHSGTKPYKCSDCDKSFALKSTLKAHAIFHSGTFRYRCSSCGKGFQTPAALKRHEIIHTGERPYPCEQCGKRFNDTSALKKHVFFHTGMKPHVCEQCGAAFATTSALRYHHLVHSGVSAFTCDECGKSFRTNSSLQRHSRIHSGEKPYLCDICPQGFAERWQLVSHRREHTGERPYECEQCGKSFVSSRKLTRHMHTHNPSHLCNECGKCFTTSSFLKIHMYKHTGEHPHQCEQCSKKFSTLALLRRHMFSHTGVKPYVCDWCGKCFTTLIALRNHTSLHTGIRPYICDSCGKGFPTKTALKIHSLFHNSEKAYQCDVCGRKFHRIYELNHHRVIHNDTKSFQCDRCDKAYHHRSALEAHMNTHTEEKWYSCDLCDKSFLREATLRKHKKTHLAIKPHPCTECGKRFVRKEHLRRHLSTHNTVKIDTISSSEINSFHDNISTGHIINLEDASMVAEHVEM